MEPYRELGLDKAESDGDGEGEELWFERQGDLDLDEERERRNEIPGLGVLESSVEVNDLAERVKDKSQAYPPARGFLLLPDGDEGRQIQTAAGIVGALPCTPNSLCTQAPLSLSKAPPSLLGTRGLSSGLSAR